MKPAVFFTGKASFFLYRKQMKRKSATKSTLILLVTIKIKVIKLVSESNTVHHNLLLFETMELVYHLMQDLSRVFANFIKLFAL